jgi:hypothetical protein
VGGLEVADECAGGARGEREVGAAVAGEAGDAEEAAEGFLGRF